MNEYLKDFDGKIATFEVPEFGDKGGERTVQVRGKIVWPLAVHGVKGEIGYRITYLITGLYLRRGLSKSVALGMAEEVVEKKGHELEKYSVDSWFKYQGLIDWLKGYFLSKELNES